MSSPFLTKKSHDVVTLVASAARTADGTSTAVRLPGVDVSGIAFVMDLTNAATDAGDTLNIFVQTKIDGTNWVDVCHFTEILGNGLDTLRFVAKVSAGEPLTMFENATALAAAAVRHLLGDEWRVRWAIVDSGNANQTFTFSVTAIPM